MKFNSYPVVSRNQRMCSYLLIGSNFLRKVAEMFAWIHLFYSILFRGFFLGANEDGTGLKGRIKLDQEKKEELSKWKARQELTDTTFQHRT